VSRVYRAIDMKIIITESQYNFIKRRIDWIDPIVRKEMRDQEPCYYKLKFGLEDGMEKYFKTVIQSSSDFILQDFDDYWTIDREEELRREEMIKNELEGFYGDEIKNKFIKVNCKFKKNLYF
jgi:hypothetical protein